MCSSIATTGDDYSDYSNITMCDNYNKVTTCNNCSSAAITTIQLQHLQTARGVEWTSKANNYMGRSVGIVTLLATLTTTTN